MAVLALTGWSWAGRSPSARWWFHRQGYHSLVLGALPGMGLLLVVGAIVGLTGGRATGLLTPMFLIGVAIVFVGIAHPRGGVPAGSAIPPRRASARGAEVDRW